MEPQQTPPPPIMPPTNPATPQLPPFEKPQESGPLLAGQVVPVAGVAHPKLAEDYRQQLLRGAKPYDEKAAQAYLALVSAEAEQKNRHFSETHTGGPGGKFIGRTLDSLRKLNPANNKQPMSRGRRVLAWAIFVAAWAAVILIVVL